MQTRGEKQRLNYATELPSSFQEGCAMILEQVLTVYRDTPTDNLMALLKFL